MEEKQLSFWNIHAFFLTFLFTFIYIFFIGIFSHSLRIQEYDHDSHYYVNRGYPISWSGVSAADYSVNFPIVKAPFLSREIYHNRYAKVIDLSVFLPLFGFVWLVGYSIVVIRWSYSKKRSKKFSLPLIYLGLILLSFFFYFVWFPRI